MNEIKHNDLISEKYQKTCKYSNYAEHVLILVLTITGCVSISAFASLVCVPVGITSSAVGIKICAITAGIKRYSQLWRKRRKIYGKTKWSHRNVWTDDGKTFFKDEKNPSSKPLLYFD